MKCLVLAALVTSVLSTTAATAAEESPNRQGTIQFNSCAKPEYPAAALAEARTGVVHLMFKVSDSGKVEESRIAKSSGHRDLDTAAREAISKCAFNPTLIDGKAIEDWIHIQYVWQK